MTDLDPFADWGRGTVEQFDLQAKRAELAALVPEDGHWPNPASLTRLGWDQMDQRMLRRFFLKVEPTQMPNGWGEHSLDPPPTPCWLWTGGTHDKGYGRFWLGLVDNQRLWAYSHRISFEHWIGFPPAGYIVDHQCNHKLCCNPTHLWPETNNDNLRLADQRRPWQRRNQYSQE